MEVVTKANSLSLTRKAAGGREKGRAGKRFSSTSPSLGKALETREGPSGMLSASRPKKKG